MIERNKIGGTPMIESARACKVLTASSVNRGTAMLFAAGLAIFAAMPATADPGLPFTGTWGANPAECQIPQDVAGAPMILTSEGYDQHETHCTFAGIAASGESEWTAKAECSVEGDTQSFDLRLSLDGPKLTITDEAGPSLYQRCP